MRAGTPKYRDPLSEIQDQVRARIIAFYKSDVLRLAALVEKYFHAIEAKDRVPESESEFGYFGRHYVLLVPTDASAGLDDAMLPQVFELQIKTLFQHAWSEANHDLGYKPDGEGLTPEEKRKLAFTSAQAWGADLIFDELFQSRNS
jgi:ppGpp synthetase/RelA/SpoT-type nucleotidyltranferase